MIYRNLLPQPGGDLAVRPGLWRCVEQADLRWFGSYRISTTDETRWILVTDASLILVDAESGATIQTITLSTGARSENTTMALVHGQVLVCVPGSGVYWGWDNNTLELIEKSTAGVFTDLDTLDHPDSGVAEYSGRAVYHDGSTVYVSDPLLPRAIVGNNAFTPPMGGRIQRLLTGENGDLWIVTSNEVYRLPSDNAGQGQGIQGGLERTREYAARSQLHVAYAGDRPWGLTARGVIPLDSMNAEEVQLVPPSGWGARSFGIPVSLDAAKLYGDGDTLMCSVGNGVVIYLDVRTGFHSLWDVGSEYGVDSELTDSYDPCGLGQTFDRQRAIGCSVGVLRLDGYSDWHENLPYVSGGVIMTDAGGPATSVVVRTVNLRTDTPFGGSFESGIDDQQVFATAENRAPAPGTVTDWATETVADGRMERYQARMEVRGDERCVELRVSGGTFRVDPGSAWSTSVSPERTHQ